MAVIVAAAGGGDWNTGGSWVGGTAPTAADDAQVPVTAGNMSVGTGAVCRSADFNTYTGTLSGTGTLTIGDATAGTGNIALRLVAGMTVTGPPNFSFISTSATQQTIDFASKNTGNVTFNPASNGSFLLNGQWGTSGISTGQSTTLTRGTLNTGGQTCFWGTFTNNSGNTRALTCGASVITMVGAGNTIAQTTPGLTFTPNTSEFIITASSSTWNGGGTFNKVTFTASGTVQVNTTFTTATWTINGPATKTHIVQLSVGVTVTSTFVIAGSSAINRPLISSNTVGTSRTITNTGATQTWSNVDFMDIALSTSFNASGITGGSGDCGGNTNITFTTPATQTYAGGVGSWSDVTKWTSRVPLPQDDVSMSGCTGGTITLDMPRLGKSIDWTGAVGNPTASFSISTSIFGSYTNIAGMTFTVTNAPVMRGRSSFTVTSAGKFWAGGVSFSAPGGTYTLNDALSTASNIVVDDGGFITGSFNCTFNTFQSTSGRTRALTLGSSTMTGSFGGGTTPWTVNATAMTFSGASATIAFTGTTTSTRTFAGGGFSYAAFTHTTAGSTGQVNITGSNTFGTITFSDVTNARTLAFTAGTTTTVSAFNVNGTSGKLMTVTSITASTHTLTSSNQQSCDFLSISNSIVDATPKWYAGANSTNGGGNTNWIFTAPPSGFRYILYRPPWRS